MPTHERRIHVVGAAILQGRACLVAQRGTEGGGCALKWEFPGGKVEPGESPRTALAREVLEELCVKVDVGSRLGRGVYSDGSDVIELDVYVARIASGEIRLTEHRRYGWFRAEQIDALDWAAADRPVLPALKRLLSNLAIHLVENKNAGLFD